MHITHYFEMVSISLNMNFISFSVCLQEDKEPVFDSVKSVIGMLEVSAEFAQNITFNQDRIQKALPAGHLDATTLADYLVHKVSRFHFFKKWQPFCVKFEYQVMYRSLQVALDVLLSKIK